MCLCCWCLCISYWLVDALYVILFIILICYCLVYVYFIDYIILISLCISYWLCYLLYVCFSAAPPGAVSARKRNLELVGPAIRDRPRALKQTAPNLSIFQQTSNDEIAHCSTTCDRIMHVCGGWDVRRFRGRVFFRLSRAIWNRTWPQARNMNLRQRGKIPLPKLHRPSPW